MQREVAVDMWAVMDGWDSPEVRGPWPVSSAIKLSGGVARVVVGVLLVRPCRGLDDGWLELSG